MSSINRGAPSESREEYWSVRTEGFNTLHERLHVIRDLFCSIEPPPASLLDVGCGGGSLRQLLPASLEYYGVDITPRYFASQPNPSHFQVVDLDRSPNAFANAQFDVVVCSGVLEYITNCDDFLRFLRAKTRRAGHLILSSTNRQHYRDLVGWLTGRQRAYKDPHVNFMLIPELISALRLHGFGIQTHRALTLSHRPLLALGRFRRFPLCVLARQYIFLCT